METIFFSRSLAFSLCLSLESFDDVHGMICSVLCCVTGAALDQRNMIRHAVCLTVTADHGEGQMDDKVP